MKIQLKRSNQLDGSNNAKAPSLGYMEYGELAVNFNEADPCIFIKASDGAGNDSIVRIAGAGAESGGLPSGGTGERPGSPTVGDLFFDTDLNLIVYWDGNQWVSVSPGVITSDSKPTESLYAAGTLWYNSDEAEGALYILYEDPAGPGANAGGKIWVQIAGGSGGSGGSVIVADTPPNAADEGDLWFDSESGRLYIWYVNTNSQGQWIDASPDGGGDADGSDFVSKTDTNSQNIESDLTLSTDKITLGVDGSATFSDSKAAIFASGGASFKNTLTVSAPGATDNVAFFRSLDGAHSSVVIEGSSDPDGIPTGSPSVLKVAKSAVTDVSISARGSARFADDKSELGITGGARFSDEITINSDTTSSYFARFNSGGNSALMIEETSDTGGVPAVSSILRLSKAANGKSIAASGSAEFAGDVTIGEPSGAKLEIYQCDSAQNNNGIQLISNGFSSALTIQNKTVVPTTTNAFTVLRGVTPTATIKTDGSAYFGGGSDFGSYLQFNTDGTRTDGQNALVGYDTNQVNSFYLRASGTAWFAGNVTADGTIGFNLEPDNDANYVTTTDAEGNETRVYNGPTLDVKDRLQNLIARLDALEADEISDDAASNALLTLIGSLTARVDARDAVIADLTARIQTLEGGN